MLRLLLRDDQWLRIEPMLLGKAGDRGRSGTDNRLFIEAVFWMRAGGVRISVCEAKGDFSTVTVAEGPFRP